MLVKSVMKTNFKGFSDTSYKFETFDNINYKCKFLCFYYGIKKTTNCACAALSCQLFLCSRERDPVAMPPVPQPAEEDLHEV